MAATLTTSQPVISKNELQTMFFKVEELHEVHTEFLNSLKSKIATESKELLIGDSFEELAKHIHLYGAFLHNYGQAIDTVKKCGENNMQFKEIVSKIVLNSQNEQLLTLENLLHKPVARLQKNALVLQDLINETPPLHADYKPLIQSQKTIHKLLSEFNVVQNKSTVSFRFSSYFKVFLSKFFNFRVVLLSFHNFCWLSSSFVNFLHFTSNFRDFFRISANFYDFLQFFEKIFTLFLFSLFCIIIPARTE